MADHTPLILNPAMKILTQRRKDAKIRGFGSCCTTEIVHPAGESYFTSFPFGSPCLFAPLRLCVRIPIAVFRLLRRLRHGRKTDLVPKLCLGMRFRAKLCFAWRGCPWVGSLRHPQTPPPAKQSFVPNCVPKQSLGTRRAEWRFARCSFHAEGRMSYLAPGQSGCVHARSNSPLRDGSAFNFEEVTRART